MNIVIEVEDVGQQKDRSEIDCVRFTKKVRDFCPTVILLAFCWSEKSELNDVLRSAGIYTGMILKEERAQITESRHVELDEGQKEFIRTVAEKKPRNIFLWGSSGAGKTLLLIEALLMKISQYRREGRQVEVIVTSFYANSSDNVLLIDFREKYLSSLAKQANVRIISLTVLCAVLGIKYDWAKPQSTLTNLIRRLAARPPLTLLLVDETKPGGGDWAAFQPCNNIDFMIALSPFSYDGEAMYQVTPPADQQLVLSRRLLTPHRNCHQVRQLNLFFLHHYGQSYLSPSEDLAAPLLPPGRLPLWVRRTEEESKVSVLEMVKEEYTNNLSVTVLNGWNSNDEARRWCRRHGWRYLEDGGGYDW